MNLELELKRFVRQIRPGLIGATANPNVNLAQLIEELKASPQAREALAAELRGFLSTRDFTTALTETGLTLESGALIEIYKRLEYKFLPKPFDHRDILSFMRRLFDAQSDAAWLETIDRQLFIEFLALILPERDGLLESLAPQFFMSLEILSLRLAGLGYEPLVTHRLGSRPELQHAFMDVTRGVNHLLSEGEAALPALHAALDRCDQAVRWVRSRRGVDGASLALTYRLMKIRQVVARMRRLLRLIEAILGDWTPEPAAELFFEIMLAEIRRFELRRFFASNIELLAFQITEHTGKAGEHYITRSRSEWKWMFRSASLGGVVVAGIATVKILAAQLHLAPAPQALAFGLIYSIGFIILHSVGATLATKQPAMTASTLAAALDEAAGSRSPALSPGTDSVSPAAMEGLADVIVRTVRSQMAALFGNYLIAFPTALLVFLPFTLIGFPLMSAQKATATLASLDGLRSLSFWYAALAGVCLFVSGLMAGAADNWFVFNKVGERLKHSEMLRRLVKPHKLDRAIHTIDHNLGFWVGNTCLGFCLGSMLSIGEILGLPLDIRHITFASAQFGAALATLKFQAPLAAIALIAVSIFLMGLVNLAVSFSLTLFVVVRSRRIRFSQTPLLLSQLALRLRRNPLQFLLPIGEPP